MTVDASTILPDVIIDATEALPAPGHHEPEHIALTLRRHGGETHPLQHQLDEVCILAEVASALSSSHQLSQILQIILTGATASQGVGFNRCFLFLHEETTGRLKGHMAVGPGSVEEAEQIWQQLADQSISLSELLAQRQDAEIERRDPITRLIEHFTMSLGDSPMLNDICARQTPTKLTSSELLDDVLQQLLAHLDTTDVALIPMTANNRLTGLLVADNNITGRSISDRDIRLLHMLANQAAVAMERASLYESQKERANELMLMNQLLADSQEKLVTIEKMSFVGELTSAVAAELKHPISVIEGFASILGQTQLSDDQKEYLRILHQETRRLESVVGQLAEFCNLGNLPNRNFDLNELMRETMNRITSHDHRLKAVTTYDYYPLQLSIEGNRAQLQMAIEQLLRLVIDESPVPERIGIKTGNGTGMAALDIRLEFAGQTAQVCSKSLHSLLSGIGNTRLPALFVNQTVRFHGGTVGCELIDTTSVLLYFTLPLIHRCTPIPEISELII